MKEESKAPLYGKRRSCCLPSTTAVVTTTSLPPDGSNDAAAWSTEGRNGSLSVNSSAGSAPEPSSSTKTKQGNKGRKGTTYDTWDHEEKQLLLELWMGNYETLQHKGSAKSMWRVISNTLRLQLGSRKDSNKCMKKMKYMIDRYRETKLEGDKKPEGLAKKSEFYDEIDSLLGATDPERDSGGGEQNASPPPPPPRLADQPQDLPQNLQECDQQELYTVHLPGDVVRHVTETVVDPSTAEEPEPLSTVASHVVQRALETPGKSTGNKVGTSRETRGTPDQNARTERKKSGKKRKAEENEDEDEDEDEEGRTLKATLEKFHEHGDRIVQCIETLSQMQSQQVQMMNQFMAAMMQFVQSERNDDRQAEQ